MAMLRRVVLSGFKSIKAMDLELGPLNVLIGANGAGKSNLVSFFKMLNEMRSERLQEYVATCGRAHTLLFYGPGITTKLQARLLFEDGQGTDAYDFALSYTLDDALFLSDERISSTRTGSARDAGGISLGGGHFETQLAAEEHRGGLAAMLVRAHLEQCRVYHFHDTSATARARQYGYVGDNRVLLADAGNLAAFLFRLQNQDEGRAYARIVRTIRMIPPFFHDFNLIPSGSATTQINLNWRDKDSDQTFGPHQLSDGTLRAISLVTLLLQPDAELPRLIVIDEPELGLHPYALNVIASLIQKASNHVQVLVSTQSSSLLDQFEPSDIIVANRQGKESVFTRLDQTSLESWLEQYSLGEVWEKNVIGGGPL